MVINRIFCGLMILVLSACATSQELSVERKNPLACRVNQSLSSCGINFDHADASFVTQMIMELTANVDANIRAEIYTNALLSARLKSTDEAYKTLFPLAELEMKKASEKTGEQYFIGIKLVAVANFAGDIPTTRQVLAHLENLTERRAVEDQWTRRIFDYFAGVTHDDAIRNIANAYANIRDIEKAISVLGKINRSDEVSKYRELYDLAKLYLIAEDYERCLELAEEAFDLARRNDESRIRVSEMMLESTIGAGSDVEKAQEQVRSALNSEDTYLSGHALNYRYSAWQIRDFDLNFATEIFGSGRLLSEIATDDLASLIIDLADDCITYFRSEECLVHLTARAETELTQNDIGALGDYVAEMYAILGQYKEAIRWTEKVQEYRPVPLPYRSIFGHALESEEAEIAEKWLEKWLADDTPFVPWSVHGWGSASDKYSPLAEAYAILSLHYIQEKKMENARLAALNSIILAIESSNWQSRSLERVTQSQGDSLGYALGAFSAIERTVP